jgi:hypothetical protein
MNFSYLFSHRASSNTLQRVFTPIRVYYHLMRWIFGKDYDPFETKMKEGLHPIPVFLKKYHFPIRVIYYAPMYILPTLSIAFILRIIQKIFKKFSYVHMKKVD